MIAPVMSASDDPRTLFDWGRICGLSASSVKVRCRAAGIRPKIALDFCRLLRVVSIDAPGTTERRLLQQLDIIDERTMRRLLRRAGISPTALARATPSEFLSTQRFVTEADYLSAVSGRITGRASCAG